MSKAVFCSQSEEDDPPDKSFFAVLHEACSLSSVGCGFSTLKKGAFDPAVAWVHCARFAPKVFGTTFGGSSILRNTPKAYLSAWTTLPADLWFAGQ